METNEEEETHDYEEEDDLKDFSNTTIQGEKNLDKPTSDLFYNVNPFLEHLKQTLLGKELINGRYVKTSHPKMRTELIKTMLNQITSVLNTHNFHSNIGQEEISNILIQQNYAFIRILRAEPSIKKPSEVESIAVFFDVTMELFIKSLKNGKGAEGVRQAISGTYQNLEEVKDQRKKGIRFGYGDNELEIGGNKY